MSPVYVKSLKNIVSVLKPAILIAVLIFSVFLSGSAFAAIPVTERAALIALYNSTDGDNWTDNSGWKTPPLETDGFAAYGTEDTWHGVTCDAGNNFVTEIHLNSNNLTGPVPLALSNLINLTGLDMRHNQLTGTIPPELGNLMNLEYLWLTQNQLTGNIPPELSGLTNLRYLNLHDNQLTGTIPTQLCNLTYLNNLDLQYNQLTGNIPSELGNLTNLAYLTLGINQLTGTIPPELGNLTNLKWLSLLQNQLTGAIPAELGNLISLQYLQLFNNQLTGNIPPELGNLSNLEWLDLNKNQLMGNIPPEIGNLTNLSDLDLQENQLTGNIPPELGNLTNLQYLDLGINQLTGGIPSELSNLTNLKRFSLLQNQLTGAIPAELGNLISLQYLQLDKNQLTGTIPAALGSLPNLWWLYLNDNQLAGPIPAELGLLSNLERLGLHNNQLTGVIPSELGNLSSLRSLLLHDNQLTGPVPSELINLTSLLDNQSDFCSNHLYTFDPTLISFLNAKQIDGDWQSTQTGGPVPDVVNVSQANAETAIIDTYLTVGAITSSCDDVIASGNVISSDPAVGASVPPGTAVDLVVSTGPCPVVPNVVDIAQATAESAITAAGLTVGNVATACDDTITAGNVIISAPPAGVSVEPGTSIGIVVSSGQCVQNTPMVYFNTLPTQLSDGSGKVDVSVEVNDNNGDDCKLKVEYSEDNITWHSATIETGSVTAQISSIPDVDNNQPYQIGSNVPISTGYSISNTIGFKWTSDADLTGSFDDTVYMRVTVCDSTDKTFTAYPLAWSELGGGAITDLLSIEPETYPWIQLELDPDGNPNIIAVSKFTKWNGSNWVKADGITPGFDEIRSPSNGLPTSGTRMKLDAAGNPYILFRTGSLYFTKWNGTEWTHADGVTPGAQIVPSVYNDFFQLEIDSNGNPAILTGSSSDVNFTKWNGTEWTYADGVTPGLEIIYDGTGTGLRILRLDPLGNPNIMWKTGSSWGDLLFTKWNGSAWTKADGITAGRDNIYCMVNSFDFKLESSGSPQVVFMSFCWYPTGGSHFLRWNGTNWRGMDGTSNGIIISDSGGNPVLEIDAKNYPHVLFTSNSVLQYSKWDGTQWVGEGNYSPFGPITSNTGTNTSLFELDNFLVPFVITGQPDGFLLTKWNGGINQSFGGSWVGLEDTGSAYDVLCASYDLVYTWSGRLLEVDAKIKINSNNIPYVAWADADDNIYLKYGGIASFAVDNRTDVPDVVNMVQATAESTITAADLTVGSVTTACDDTIAAGNVISSDPAAGTSLAPGTAVDLVVSTGPCPVDVPDVVNMTQTAAESAIVSAGLVVGTETTACDNTIAAGNVISSDPTAGTSVPPGTAVDLVVSPGPCPVDVPDVVNMTQAAAESAITSAGLMVGTETNVCDNTIAAGNVINTTPSAGASVAPGTSVDFVVSTGPCPLVNWSTAAQTAVEDIGAISVTAELAKTGTADVTVPYTVSGTADASDHDLVDGEITITAGNLTGSSIFNIIDDTEVETDETVIVTMGTPTNANLGTTTVHTVTITDNDCIYALNSGSEFYAATSGSGSVFVDATDEACTWHAASNDDWITIQSGTDYTGDDWVSYDVAANPDPGSRVGTLTIAGESFTVLQAGTGGVVEISDDFDGNDPEIWYPVSLVGTDASASIVSEEFQFQVNSINGQAIYAMPYAAATDCIFEGKISEIDPDDNFYASVILRGNGETGTGYAVIVSSTPNTIEISKLFGGGADPVPLAVQSNDLGTNNIQIKFAVVGTNLFVKIWPIGSPEPNTWDLTANDSSYSIGGCAIGILSKNYSSAQVAFDDVLMTTDVSEFFPSLLWNTFTGSSTDDYGRSVAVDSDGNIYITGKSDATWGSPVNAFAGGTDIVVAKFSCNGILQWNTFMGSSNNDSGNGISVDGNGNIFVAGVSDTAWGTPLNSHSGGEDACLIKLDTNGNFIWNTFLGSSGNDSVHECLCRRYWKYLPHRRESVFLGNSC